MKRPPRNLKTDRLLSFQLFMYSYIVWGLAEAVAGFIAYILLFNYWDLSLSDIYDTTSQNYWLITGSNSYFCGKHRCYDSDTQVHILKQLNACTMFNIVLCQFCTCSLSPLRVCPGGDPHGARSQGTSGRIAAASRACSHATRSATSA